MSKNTSKWKYAGNVILLLFIVTLLLLQFDDDLSEDASIFIRSAEQSRAEDPSAYYYALGFDAGAELDPEKVGRDYISDFSEWRKTKRTNLLYESEGFSLDSEGAGLDYDKDAKLLCGSDRDELSECLTYIFEHHAEIPQFVSDNDILLQRYQKLLSYPYSGYSGNQYSYTEPMPPYLVIANSTRLYLLTIVDDAMSSNKEVAMNKFMRFFKATRERIKVSGSMIDKSIQIRDFDHGLNLFYQLYRQGYLDSASGIIFSPLNSKERSMLRPMASEFMFMVNGMEEMQSTMPLYEGSEWTYPKWIVRTVIKTNMSLNTVAPYHMSSVRYAEKEVLTADDVKTGKMPEPPLQFRNIVASTLMRIAIPMDRYKYVQPIHALNYKMRMMNVVLSLPHDADYFDKDVRQLLLDSNSKDIGDVQFYEDRFCGPFSSVNEDSLDCLYL